MYSGHWVIRVILACGASARTGQGSDKVDAMSQANEPDRIGAIILAAGSSRRMGRNKSLLPIDGVPMIARVVEMFIAIGAQPIVVVTGHEPDMIKAALSQLSMPVEFTFNANHETGEMLSSIKLGVAATRARADAFFLALGDQPGLRHATLQQLTEARRHSHGDVVRPVYHGKHGHPILIDSRCVDSILALPDRATLNEFVRANSTKTIDVPVEDAATIQDIDTPADYEAAMKRRDSSSAE